MTTGLRERWRSQLELALSWKPGQDPEPVLEALCYLLVLRIAGELGLVTARQARALGKLGAQCLLGLGGSGRDEEERLLLDRVSGQARAGLSLLKSPRGKPRVRAARVHPSDARLVRMLNGRLDGLTAGETAAHVLGCVACSGKTETCLLVGRLSEQEESMALAAASPGSVRPPGEGRTVGTRKRPALEAVLFEEGEIRRLAVYADEMVTIRLVAEGVTTDQALAGYWIGTLRPGVEALSATVHVGGRAIAWKLDLRR